MQTASRIRDGSLVVTAVLFTALMGLGGIMVSRQLERDLARQLRSASDGRELEPLLAAAVEEAHYQLVIGQRPGSTGTPRSEHDPVAFLREGTRPIAFVPEVAAAGLPEASGIQLDPVEVQVVDRDAGPWKRASADLPTLFTALRTTWGVVELRAAARWAHGRGPVAARRLTERRLFTVVDHVWDTGETRGYAHVFPGAIARVMEGE